MKNIDYSETLKMTPEELRSAQKKRGWIMSYIGFAVYFILRKFGLVPQSFHGICEYFIFGKSWGGISLGTFFICCKNASESVKMHELGHGLQNASMGAFRMAFLCIGSLIRCTVRKIFGSKKSYDSWWFEGQATQIGRIYTFNIKEGKNDSE